MISLQSLSEQLLPKVYVKRLSLETNYKTIFTESPKKSAAGLVAGEKSAALAPSNSVSCRISLSIKFPHSTGTGFEADLLNLLDSEYAQNYYIYAHQITDKDVFDIFSSTNSAIYNSDGTLTSFAKTDLLNLK